LVLLSIAGLVAVTWLRPEIVRRATQLGSSDETLLRAAGDHDMRGVEDALAMGANIEAQSVVGCTPLMIATTSHGHAIVAFLLNHGADPEDVPPNLVGSLHLAVSMNDEETVRLLLEHGANPNHVCRGVAPLDSAEALAHTKIAALLRARGAKHATQLTGEADDFDF
jgi:ankyrin repeat protein